MIVFPICLGDWLQVGDQVVLRFADFVRLDLTGLLGDLSDLGAGLVMALLGLLYEPDVLITINLINQQLTINHSTSVSYTKMTRSMLSLSSVSLGVGIEEKNVMSWSH